MELIEIVVLTASVITAVSVILFSLLHWPCSTTVLTIKKETGSTKWTLVSIAVPTVLGIVSCFVVNWIMGIIIPIVQ